MLFSATKSVLSTVAGLAFDRGLIRDLDEPVWRRVALPELDSVEARATTWRHLLQQTSGWQGVLWDKPTWVDAQSRKPGSTDTPMPGAGWAYNDVRVNLLSLALTQLFAEHLYTVLSAQVMQPIGASPSWRWYGYANARIRSAGRELEVVSGGAHWGGGLWMSARDLALLGQLYLQAGRWRDRTLLSSRWIEETFRPCERQRDYGLLWWLNDAGRVITEAPRTGRCARGNGGRHLLWLDPARELVIASHWGERIGQLIVEVSAAIDA
jgi:CubicO group peptidase (beta-lactamase class C family)